MPLELSITRDLFEALTRESGIAPTVAGPVVQLAAYLDRLARGYGLSESGSVIPEDLLVQAPFPRTSATLSLVFGNLGESAQPADEVRSVLRSALATIVSDRDLQRRAGWNENGLLSIAQVYWNLEAAPGSPVWPIVPDIDGSRDIPIAGTAGDYAVLKQTDRMKVGVRWPGGQTSAGALRKAGARIAVLLAEHLVRERCRGQLAAEDQVELRILKQRGSYAEVVWARSGADGVALASEVAEGAAPEPRRPTRRILLNLPAEPARYQRRSIDDEIDRYWDRAEDRRIWLRGSPGQGKTYAARRVVSEALLDVENGPELLLWVDRAEVEVVRREFSEAARRLQAEGELASSADSPEMADRAVEFLSWLRTSQRPWLIVLDDGDPEELGRHGMLPTGRNLNGRVLVTTVVPARRITEGGLVIETDVFDAHEAEEFLTNRLVGNSTSPDVRGRIAAMLGRHPLGLSIAASTIEHEYLDPEDWLAEFERLQSLDEAASARDTGGYPHSLAATWRLALDRAGTGFRSRSIERAALLVALHPFGLPSWLWTRDEVSRWVLGGEAGSGGVRIPPEIDRLARFGVVELRGGSWKRGRAMVHQLAARAIMEQAGSDLVAELAGILARTWLLSLTDGQQSPERHEVRRGVEVLDTLPGLSEAAANTITVLLSETGASAALNWERQALDQVRNVPEHGGASGRLWLSRRLHAQGIEEEANGLAVEARESFQEARELLRRVGDDDVVDDELKARVFAERAELELLLGEDMAADESRRMARRLFENLGDRGTDISEDGVEALLKLGLPGTGEGLLEDSATISRGSAEVENPDGAVSWMLSEERRDLLRRARILRLSGKSAQAREALARAVELDAPGHWRTDIHTQIAQTFTDEGDWERALKTLSDVGAGESGSLAAALLLRLGRPEDSERVLTMTARDARKCKREISVDQVFTPPVLRFRTETLLLELQELAVFSLRTGRNRDAEHLAEALIMRQRDEGRSGGGSHLHLIAGTALRSQGNFDASMRHFEGAAIELDASHHSGAAGGALRATTHTMLAELRMLSGEFPDAVTAAEAAIAVTHEKHEVSYEAELEPIRLRALRSLRDALDRSGNTTRAIEAAAAVVGQVRARQEPGPELIAELSCLASLCLALGTPAGAVEAERVLGSALEAIDALEERAGVADTQAARAILLAELAETRFSLGLHEAGIELLEAACGLLETAATDGREVHLALLREWESKLRMHGRELEADQVRQESLDRFPDLP